MNGRLEYADDRRRTTRGGVTMAEAARTRAKAMQRQAQAQPGRRATAQPTSRTPQRGAAKAWRTEAEAQQWLRAARARIGLPPR